MPTAPPTRIELDGLVMRRETIDDAPAVAEAIASNISRLAPWMEWAVADAAQVTTQRTRIADTIASWNAGKLYDYLITDASDRTVLGKIGFSRYTDAAEIGYWVTAGAEGSGVVTRAAGTLTTVASELEEVTRVEIHCDEANTRSRAVPERLGFRLDRTVDHPITTSNQTGRQMIWIHDAF